MKKKTLRNILFSVTMGALSILPNISSAQTTDLPSNIDHPMYGLNYFVPAFGPDFATNLDFYGSGDVDGDGDIDIDDYTSPITGTDPFNDGTHRGDTDLDGVSGTAADKQIIWEYLEGERTHINVWELETKEQQENHLEKALAIDPTSEIGPSSGWECHNYSDQLDFNLNGVYNPESSIFAEDNETNLQFDLSHNGIFRIPSRTMNTMANPVGQNNVAHSINFCYISNKENENVKDLNKKMKIEPQTDEIFYENSNLSMDPNEYAYEIKYSYLNNPFEGWQYLSLPLCEYSLSNGQATLTYDNSNLVTSWNPFNDNGVEGMTVSFPENKTHEYKSGIEDIVADEIINEQPSNLLYYNSTQVKKTSSSNRSSNPNDAAHYNFDVDVLWELTAGKYEMNHNQKKEVRDRTPPVYNTTSKIWSDVSGSPVFVTTTTDTTDRSCDGLSGIAKEYKKGTDVSGNSLEVLTKEEAFNNVVLPTYISSPADMEYTGNPNDSNPLPDLTGAPEFNHPTGDVEMFYSDETVREAYGEKDIKRTFWGESSRSDCERSQDTTQMIYVKSGVGVVDLTTIPIFSVYPNPANEIIWVRWDGFPTESGRHPLTLQLIDLTGKIIFNKEINASEFEINVSDYPSGIYFINIINDYQVVKQQKIIIQK